MKQIIIILGITFLFCQNVNAQFIAKVQMKEKVEGICDHDNVLALFDGLEGQKSAKSEFSKEEMQKILNENIQFLKDNPKFSSKGMIGCYINCKGEPLKWRMDGNNRTKSKEFDKQFEEVCRQKFTKWTVATYNGKPVDSSELISFKVKKGKIILN